MNRAPTEKPALSVPLWSPRLAGGRGQPQGLPLRPLGTLRPADCAAGLLQAEELAEALVQVEDEQG